MGTTARGAPQPAGTDSNDAALWLQRLAGWVNDRPGIATLSTTQRNALGTVELWAGRVIWNTTTARLETYDGATWQSDTDWVDVGPDSLYGWNGTLSYARRARMVTVTLGVTRDAFQPGNGIWAMPVGFRPTRRIVAAAVYGDNVRSFEISANTGSVIASGQSGSTIGGGIYGSVTYPVG